MNLSLSFLWNLFFCISKTTLPTYQGQEHQVQEQRTSPWKKTVPLFGTVFSLLISPSPFSRTTWIFTLTWHFHHNQSSSVPVGGNPDLSEQIFPDDIPVPTTANLYLYICCRKYIIQYRSGIRTALFNAYDLTVKRVLTVLYVRHDQALYWSLQPLKSLVHSQKSLEKVCLLPRKVLSRNTSLSPTLTLRTTIENVLKLLNVSGTVIAILQLIVFFIFQCHCRDLGSIMLQQ